MTVGLPYTILSFDVFDTLIFRRCHHEVIVEGVGRRLTQECSEAGIRIRSDAMTCRERAYRKLTAVKMAQGLDPDCSLTALCRAWVEEITGGQHEQRPNLAHHVEAYEVELEKTACFANESFVKLLRASKGEGLSPDLHIGYVSGQPRWRVVG